MKGLEGVASVRNARYTALRSLVGHQVGRFRQYRLYTNSTYLIADQALTALTGFLFWIIVARLYTSEHVGLAAALISSIMLLANISTLGFNFAFLQFIPDSKFVSEDVINRGLTTVAPASLTVAVVFLAGLPLWSPSLRFIGDSISLTLTLILGTLAWGLFTLLDSAFVGLRRAIFVPIKNLSSQVLRLLLIALAFALGGLGVQGIVSAWTFPVLAVLGISLFHLLPTAGRSYKPKLSLRFWSDRETLSFSLLNHTTNLGRLVPGYLFVIIIVNVVSEDAGAYFFVAWSISALLMAVSYSTSNVLLSESSFHSNYLGRNIRMALLYTGVVVVPAILILVSGASYLLHIYGGEYSDNGANVLRLLALSALPSMFNHIYLTLARLQRDTLTMAAFPAGLLVVSITLGSVFVQIWGATGVAAAWLLAQSIAALFTAPKVLSVCFEGKNLSRQGG